MKTNYQSRFSLGINSVSKLPGAFLLGLACTSLLAGCGSPDPTKCYIRTGPNYAGAIAGSDRLGLISDAAVMYDRVSGRERYSLEDSLITATNMLADARRHLERKGYQVVFAQGPLVGACLDAGKSYGVAERRHQNPTDRSAPFYLPPGLADDQPYCDAVLRVVKRVKMAVSDRGELPTESLREEPALQESLKLIAEHNQVRYLLVLNGQGKIVSGGKQVGQEIGTALLSTLMTGGLITASAHNISLLDCFIGLVDLETGEMLWTNSLRLGQNPANEGLYKGAWSRALLFHLPDRTHQKSSS